MKKFLLTLGNGFVTVCVSGACISMAIASVFLFIDVGKANGWSSIGLFALALAAAFVAVVFMHDIGDTVNFNRNNESEMKTNDA